MTFKKLLVASSAGVFIFWGSALAQETPAPGVAASTADPDPTSTSANVDTSKEKHWSGNLVDVQCMVNMLNDKSGAGAEESGTGAPHFMGSGLSGQVGQQPGVPTAPGGQTPGQGQATAPSLPSEQQGAQNPNMTPAQSAEMARAERIDNAARQCPASASTQKFGLSMSGGQVVQFDNSGNTKAQDALREVAVKPGKNIKAKVTGTMQDKQVVRVASVEVKGKRAGNASGAGQ